MRLTTDDIAPPLKAIHAQPVRNIAVADEQRMTRRLEEYINEQIKDGVQSRAVLIAFENAVKHIEIVQHA